jgi:hypothetical protein
MHGVEGPEKVFSDSWGRIDLILCVSAIVPIYNRRECVREAIDGGLGRTGTDDEIVVIDNRSMDETSEALSAPSVTGSGEWARKTRVSRPHAILW